jgi:preprotein translocase subunit SecB
MPKRKPTRPAKPASQVRSSANLVGMALHEARFKRIGPWPVPREDDGFDADTQFGLTARRLNRGELGVELELKVTVPEVFESAVSYRMQFSFDPDEIDEMETCRAIAARVAPIVSYPYIREVLSSLAMRAGSPVPFTLPVLNVGAMFDPESIEITDEASQSNSQAAIG